MTLIDIASTLLSSLHGRRQLSVGISCAYGMSSLQRWLHYFPQSRDTNAKVTGRHGKCGARASPVFLYVFHNGMLNIYQYLLSNYFNFFFVAFWKRECNIFLMPTCEKMSMPDYGVCRKVEPEEINGLSWSLAWQIN